MSQADPKPEAVPKHASFLQRTPLVAARARLLEGVAPVGDEEVAVDDASGRIAAETVVARHASPHYRASAMDGIAVRSADTREAAGGPIELRVVGAGEAAPEPGLAACVPVDTGSLLPPWADAVVRIEQATPVDGGVRGYRIASPVPPGNDVRHEGEDIPAGAVVVAAGRKLRPWDLGALLATGTTSLRVRRRPRVAILATGSEVVEPGAAAAAGRVIESNSRVIAAFVEEWGGSAHRLGIVPDDESSLAAAIGDAARRFDAVAVIAGSSAGRRDLTIPALAALGEVFVHGVDVAPGRPVALARLRRDDGATPAIAVPGYPVSAIVVCEQLLRPLVSALLGAAEPLPARLVARTVRKIPSRLGMEEFRRVCLVRQPGGDYVVATLPSGAASISSVAGAHAWLRIAAEAEGVDAGAEVEVELLVPREDVDSAVVLAGSPSDESAALEVVLCRADPRARVAHLRRGPNDVLSAVASGEAHGAILTPKQAATAGAAFELRALAGTTMQLAVRHGRD